MRFLKERNGAGRRPGSPSCPLDGKYSEAYNFSRRPLVPPERGPFMAKVAPYHTDSPEYPPQNREVHHDHDDCYEGKKIKSEHRKNGTGGKPRCKVCIDLD